MNPEILRKNPAALESLVREILTRTIEAANQHALAWHVAVTGERQAPPDWHHVHEVPEFLWQIQGSNEFLTANESWISPPGGLVLVPPGVHHEETRDPHRKRWSHLCASLTSVGWSIHLTLDSRQSGKQQSGIVAAAQIPSRNAPLCLSLAHECARLAAVMPARKTGEVIESILSALMQCFLHALDSSAEDDGTSLSASALRLIRLRLHDPNLSVRDLADKLKCHPDHLSRTFHRETREKLVQCIQRLRVELTEGLIRSRQISIQDAARMAGFREHAYFCRVFKKLHGCAPGEWAKRVG